MNSTSITLLDRLREGGSDSDWEKLSGAYSPPIYVFAMRHGCSREMAEDIVQEVLLEFYRGRSDFRYDPAKGRFRNWLFTIAWRKICAIHRKGNAPGEVAILEKDHADAKQRDPSLEFQELFEHGLIAAMLDAVRREVEPTTYQAFELTARRGLGAKEAGAMTGLSANAVFKACQRVRSRLKELGAPYVEGGNLASDLRDLVDFFPAARIDQRLTETLQKSRVG